ncbi:DUF222 domain-containing protein [Agrococcus sp. KRD186]|uniref:DUF222 domain-containing protein n=1 Tax=Agrococcus sp. KRD186 TaxID=2729730 RepID=UPI0019D02B75
MTRIEQAAAAVAAAQAAFADAAALESAPEAEIAGLLTQIAALARLVQAQQVRLAGAIDSRSLGSPETDLCRKLGKDSAKEAVAAAFGIRVREAQDLLSMARSTARGMSMTGGDIEIKYPSVATALDAGELSLSQARAIVRTLEPAASRADLEQLAWAERCLVDAALDPERPLAPELLVDQARLFAAVIDPDGVQPNGERQRAMRSLKLWQRADGMWPLEALFTPEAGSELKAMLDALTGPRVRVRFRDDADSAEQQEPVDDRSIEQRRHDALLGIVRAQAASGKAPTVGGEVPRLVFNVTEEAFEAYRRGLEHPDRTLQIEHTGALVPIETVDRLLCDAVVQRAVVSASGEVLDLGRTKRDFNRAQRRALAKQYGGCANCGAPASWCEAHHVLWWVRGGPTDLKNGLLLCSHCHHEVHAGRLVVVGEPGNWRVVAQLRPPDRYARSVRGDQRRGIASAPGIGALARIAVQRGALASAMRGPEPILADADGPESPAGGAAVLAADAAPSLAVRIWDGAPARTRAGKPTRTRGTPARARQPRTSAGAIEQRLRRRLSDCRRSAPPRPAVDYLPSIPVVLRP